MSTVDSAVGCVYARRMDEDKLQSAAWELRKAGWTVREPHPEKVIDNEGDTWIRCEDGYRYIHKSDPATSLDYIRRHYGIQGEA